MRISSDYRGLLPGADDIQKSRSVSDLSAEMARVTRAFGGFIAADGQKMTLPVVVSKNVFALTGQTMTHTLGRIPADIYFLSGNGIPPTAGERTLWTKTRIYFSVTGPIPAGGLPVSILVY